MPLRRARAAARWPRGARLEWAVDRRRVAKDPVKSIHETYRELVALLPAASRRFLRLFMTASVLLAMLDALALGVLALVITPLASGGALKVPGVDVTLTGGQ